MALPRETVLICTTPRSGSSFLSEALGSIGIGDPNEWFVDDSLNYARKEAGLPPGASMLETVTAVMRQKTNAAGVFAVKVMWENFGPIVWKIRRENPELGSMPLNEAIRTVFPHPRFIHLYRDDRLKQAISYVKAEQSDVWSGSDPATARYDAGQLSFQFEAIRYRLACFDDADRCWQDFFLRSEVNPLRLTYERVTGAPERSLREIAHFLERPPPADGREVKTRQVRMSDGINRDWQVRYEALDARIRRNEAGEEVPVLDPKQACGRIDPARELWRVHRSDRWALPIEVSNRGGETWPCVGYADLRDAVVVIARLFDAAEEEVGEPTRIVFEEDVEPGATVEAFVAMIAPSVYGRFRLELELAQIGRSTFARQSVVIEVLPTWIERKWNAYFPEAVETSWGWRHDPVFGYMNTLQYPWLFHDELGWIYCSGTGGRGDDYWFRDWKLGLLWTTSRDFPYVYSFDRDAWLEYERESREPRRFYDLTAEEWIEVGRVG